MTLTLNNDEYRKLTDPKWKRGVVKGGFQSFMEGLSLRTNPKTKQIHLDVEAMRKIRRYAFNYGGGGWQDALLAIFGRLLGDKLDKHLPPEGIQGEMFE